MISELQIENLGIIEHAQLEFSPQLTVLTGETGAGKTMVLSSLRLLTGGKADKQAVRVGAQELSAVAIIEGIPQALDSACQLGGRVDEDLLFITRTVRDSRSRAFIGGRAVPASALEDLGQVWVKIHGQSDQIKLRSSVEQRNFLDRFGGEALAQALAKHTQAWDDFVAARTQLEEFEHSADKRNARMEFLRSEIGLIEGTNPTSGEDDELRATIGRLTNIEDIQHSVTAAIASIDALSESGLPSVLLARSVENDTTLANLCTALDSAEAVFSDARIELASYRSKLEQDPDELEKCHQRLAALKSLLAGRATNIDELLASYEEYKTELAALIDGAESGDHLVKAVAETKEAAEVSAAVLTQIRKDAATQLCKVMASELDDLAMQGTHIVIDINTTVMGRHGCDNVEFLMHTEHNKELRNLSATASGGELSRIMLALEIACLSGTPSAKETLIFDEIDAGIGGVTALAVGQRLARLATQHQVIVVTHLPQVACWADKHLVVCKKDGVTSVVEVRDEERVGEIARMLSGKSQSKSARVHAVELIEAASVE